MNFFSMRSEDFPELPWKKNISGNIVCLVLSISFFCGWKIVQLDVARLLLFVGSIIETGCTIIQIIQIKAGFLLRKMSPQNGYNKDFYHKGGGGSRLIFEYLFWIFFKGHPEEFLDSQNMFCNWFGFYIVHIKLLVDIELLYGHIWKSILYIGFNCKGNK